MAQVTTDGIKQALVEAGDGFALDMLTAVIKRAAIDQAYNALLAKWLKSGSTVLLRNEICWPFREGSIVENYRPTKPLPFVNTWEAIDSAWLSVKRSAA